MLKIQLASDLHTEMHRDGGEAVIRELFTDADVLVLAGDIGCVRFAGDLQSLLRAAWNRYPHVVYVPGNHEYYGTSPDEAWKLFKQTEALLPNVHIAKNEIVTIYGQRFLCGTGWFPETQNPSAKRFMNDFFQIKQLEPWVYGENLAMKRLLCSVEPDDVVITHHLPTGASTSPRFVGSALNDFFISGFDEALGIPKLWLHGHTHDSKDYVVGNTRVVCNPFGYPTERTTFDSRLVIEV